VAQIAVGDVQYPKLALRQLPGNMIENHSFAGRLYSSGVSATIEMIPNCFSCHLYRFAYA
jgi:hypothetical protein